MLRNSAEFDASATCSVLRAISDTTSITLVLPLSRSAERTDRYGVVSAAANAHV